MQLKTREKKLEARARKQAEHVRRLEQENGKLRDLEAEQRQMATLVHNARFEQAEREQLERQCEQTRELCERQRADLQKVLVSPSHAAARPSVCVRVRERRLAIGSAFQAFSACARQ